MRETTVEERAVWAACKARYENELARLRTENVHLRLLVISLKAQATRERFLLH